MMKFADSVRIIPDFPKPGVMFRDISTLLADSVAFRECIDELIGCCQELEFDRIGAFDARGFPFGAVVAYELGKPLFLLRKAGKLPYKTIQQSYALEYGKSSIEIQEDAVLAGEKIILLDDLLATGGTMQAGCKLVEKLGAEVALCLCVMELNSLGGRNLLPEHNVKSLLQF